MKKVIVLGSLNMDLSICCENLPRSGETLNGYDFFINPGGKGGNQAVASAKLGADTYMIGNVGNDIFGKQLIDTLTEYKVDTTYVDISQNDASGVAVIICHENDNRIVLGNGANHSLKDDYVKKAIDELAVQNDIFLTQLENQYELVRDAIVYAKRKGLYTILNPAPAKALDDIIYEHLDLLVVNQSECELLSGIYPETDEDCRNAIEYFEKKKVQVLITLGKSGSVVKNNNQLVKINSRKVETVDTTGAGDSYIGALCAQLAKDVPMEDALKFSTDVAAICVTRRGAQVSMPTLSEVIEIYKEEK